MAGDDIALQASCLKMQPKFKMAARGQLQIFFVGAKTVKLKVRSYSNFTIILLTI